MSPLASIDQKKKLFRLPFTEDELEYWGPLNHAFCNSFLTMANTFFEKFLDGKDIKTVKSVFSAFVELVQNVAEYNERGFSPNYPSSYVNVGVKDSFVMIKTANRLIDKDLDAMKDRMESLDNYSKEELQDRYKMALLNNQSLGLIMIKRMSNAHLEWGIHKQEGQHWLLVELKIDYGKA